MSSPYKFFAYIYIAYNHIYNFSSTLLIFMCLLYSCSSSNPCGNSYSVVLFSLRLPVLSRLLSHFLFYVFLDNNVSFLFRHSISIFICNVHKGHVIVLYIVYYVNLLDFTTRYVEVFLGRKLIDIDTFIEYY